MQGFPRTIATTADIENLLAVPEYRDRVLAYLQTLLDERYGWVADGRLADDEPGDTSAGHKVDIVPGLVSGDVIERYQYSWGVVPGNGLDRLGVTAAECVAWGCADRVINPPATAG